MKIHSSFSVSLLAVMVVVLPGVLSCAPKGGKYGDFGGDGWVVPEYYSHLDASKHPTLSTKIRHVLADHYKMVGHPSGDYQHGLEGNKVLPHQGHSVSHHEGPNHGWQNSGYEFGAHSNPVVQKGHHRLPHREVELKNDVEDYSEFQFPGF